MSFPAFPHREDNPIIHAIAVVEYAESIYNDFPMFVVSNTQKVLKRYADLSIYWVTSRKQ